MKTLFIIISLNALTISSSFAGHTFFRECRNFYTEYREGKPYLYSAKSEMIKGITYNDKTHEVILDITKELPNSGAPSIFSYEDVDMELTGIPSNKLKRLGTLKKQRSIIRNYRFKAPANQEGLKNLPNYKVAMNMAVTVPADGVGEFAIIENYLYEDDFSVARNGDSKFYLSFNTDKDTNEARYYDNRYDYSGENINISKYYSKRNRTLYVELEQKIKRTTFNKVVCYVEK